MWLPLVNAALAMISVALHQCPSANVAAIGKCCTSNDFGSTSPVSECKCGCHFGTHFTSVRVQMWLPLVNAALAMISVALHQCPSANVAAISVRTSPESECKCCFLLRPHSTRVRVQMCLPLVNAALAMISVALHQCPSANVAAISIRTSPVSECKCSCHW